MSMDVKNTTTSSGLDQSLKVQTTAPEDVDRAEINTEVEIDFNLKDCKKVALDRKKIIAKFKELGFYSLIKRLPEGDVWLGEF